MAKTLANKELIIKEMLACLAVGTRYQTCANAIVSKWQSSTRTYSRYWDEAQRIHLGTFQVAKEKVIETITVELTEAMKNGLKSKIQRMVEIQKIIDEGTHEEAYLNSMGKVVRYHRRLKPLEIKALHAELSLMGGDYAARGIKIGEDPDNPMNQGAVVPFTDEQVDKILNAFKAS